MNPSRAMRSAEVTVTVTDICLRPPPHCCIINPRMKRKIDFDISNTRSVAPEAGSSSSGSSSINPWTQRSYSSKYYEILQKRKQLPVYEFKDALEKAVKENQVVIVEGETGSGETLSSLIN
jgi:HrpA-like RNA helicase